MQQKGALVLQESLAIVKITDETTYQKVCSQAKDAAANIKALKEHIDPVASELYGRWKNVCERRSTLLAPFEQVKDRSARLIGAYDEEQRKKAAEEEQRLREQAQKEEELRRAREAEQLAKEGRVEEGVALLESPAVATEPVIVAPQRTKVSGISAPRIKYKALVENFADLVKAVAEGKVPIKMLQANESELNKAADFFKETLDYPGVKLVKEAKASIRA
jgi:hypothetical protein